MRRMGISVMYWLGSAGPLSNVAPPCWLRDACNYLLIIFIAVFAWSHPATAHSWYPWECCSDYDCAPIPLAETPTERDGGFALQDGRHVVYREIKPSPDGRWHLCEQKHQPLTKDRKILCLWAPVGGS